jgi:ABC-2 type transport system ATP-binding protein
LRSIKRFLFLGANGAKTTAMKMLIGISTPTSGEAVVAGYNVKSATEMVKKSIGYMSKKFSMYDDLTVKENITFFYGIYGLSRVKIKEKRAQLVSELGLENAVDKLVGDLPLGWKQKPFQWLY